MSHADTPSSGTTSEDVDPMRTEVAAAAPGDQVDLAIDSYNWSNPLDVVDADDPVEWDTPFADGWWTRTLLLEATSVEYELEYSSIPDPARVELYRVEDGERGEKRGDVEQLAVVENDNDDGDSDDEGTTNVDVELPDRLTPEDVEDAVDDNRHSHGMAKLGDVADALDLSVGRTRMVLVALDLYGDNVQEVYRPKGGGRDA
ncbi:hypothetical protein [Halorussus sp. AFM4]|uniref:hypothetical protein n=1 Tax=Halorussus sp. AFM4 TaxID=3421651 RepID=UPI003EBCA308